MAGRGEDPGFTQGEQSADEEPLEQAQREPGPKRREGRIGEEDKSGRDRHEDRDPLGTEGVREPRNDDDRPEGCPLAKLRH